MLWCLQGIIGGGNVQGIEYRDVVGFSGYRVGSDGSVWSCWELVPGTRGDRGKIAGTFSRLGKTWRRLVPGKQPSGHLFVVLRGDVSSHRGGYQRRVHRLVLEAFAGPAPAGMEGCHDDGDPTNNSITNLRWDTHAANVRDTVEAGRHARGETHGGAVLTDDLVRLIRAEGAADTGYGSYGRIGRKVGVNPHLVGRIIRNERWQHVT